MFHKISESGNAIEITEDGSQLSSNRRLGEVVNVSASNLQSLDLIPILDKNNEVLYYVIKQLHYGSTLVNGIEIEDEE